MNWMSYLRTEIAGMDSLTNCISSMRTFWKKLVDTFACVAIVFWNILSAMRFLLNYCLLWSIEIQMPCGNFPCWEGSRTTCCWQHRVAQDEKVFCFPALVTTQHVVIAARGVLMNTARMRFRNASSYAFSHIGEGRIKVEILNPPPPHSKNENFSSVSYRLKQNDTHPSLVYNEYCINWMGKWHKFPTCVHRS